MARIFARRVDAPANDDSRATPFRPADDHLKRVFIPPITEMAQVANSYLFVNVSRNTRLAKAHRGV